MSFKPVLLEDSLDPWLAVEPDPERRETAIRFLMALCDSEDRWDDARALTGTMLPAFARMVPGAGVVVVVGGRRALPPARLKYLYDISTGQRFGG